ncbi:MAG: hypothetical protein WEE89_20160 [Gemmatimonadota bacterium]
MNWKAAFLLSATLLTPLSAQQSGRHRPVRVDIPPIHVNVPEIRIAMPAMNFEFPGINIDLSHLGAEIESAVNEAMRAIDELDFDNLESDRLRVQRLRRQWRDTVRRAETTNDWDEADALARQLTRAADRLKRYEQ